MELRTPGVRKYHPTSALLASSAGLGWSTISAELRSHGVSEAPAIVRTMYGLTSSILAGNTDRAFELAPKILAGIVNVNSPTVNDEIHAPMGAVRDSGWGRTGPDSLKDSRTSFGATLTAASAYTRSDRNDSKARAISLPSKLGCL